MPVGFARTVDRIARLFQVFFFHRGKWDLESSQYQVCFILNDPLNRFAPLEFHSLCHGSRKVYVPLLTLLSLNQLDLGWITHFVPP